VAPISNGRISLLDPILYLLCWTFGIESSVRFDIGQTTRQSFDILREGVQHAEAFSLECMGTKGHAQ
jgi:hypothetical protein